MIVIVCFYCHLFASDLYRALGPAVLEVVVFAYFFEFVFFQGIAKEFVHAEQIELLGGSLLRLYRFIQVVNQCFGGYVFVAVEAADAYDQIFIKMRAKSIAWG